MRASKRRLFVTRPPPGPPTPMLASPSASARLVHNRGSTHSSMQPVAKAHLQIHVCVLLWGFTPILGKLITLPAPALVIWRMSLVVWTLSRFFRACGEGGAAVLATAHRPIASPAALVSIHWLAFYAAIKLANASVAATCLALAPVFLALIEPLRRAASLRSPRACSSVPASSRGSSSWSAGRR
jgi:hypothetical protein